MKITEIILEYKTAPLEEFGGLSFRIVADNGQLMVNAFDPDWNTEIGHVTFNIGDSDELDPQDLFVKEKYRNQGVAQTMYDFVKSHGYKIQRSWDQTDAGAGFWDKHRGDERVWEEINPQTRQGDFKDQREINGLVYSADSEVEEYRGRTYTKLHVTVHNKQSQRMGYAWFTLPDNDAGAMTCSFITVPDQYQKQGIAKTMYAYARQLGNSIERSSTQLGPGKAMWSSWDKSGFSKELAEELNLQKGQWTTLLSAADKAEAGPELVDLVKHAYSMTDKGSMIHSLREVIPSDWKVIDWDNEPDIDACIFYRGPRGNESWSGYKIQGLGHDGTPTSKQKAITQMLHLLGKPGVWIESSHALRHVLNKMSAPAVTDVRVLQRIFNDPNIQMIDDKTYRRTLHDGTVVTETVFGHPKVK